MGRRGYGEGDTIRVRKLLSDVPCPRQFPCERLTRSLRWLARVEGYRTEKSWRQGRWQSEEDTDGVGVSHRCRQKHSHTGSGKKVKLLSVTQHGEGQQWDQHLDRYGTNKRYDYESLRNLSQEASREKDYTILPWTVKFAGWKSCSCNFEIPDTRNKLLQLRKFKSKLNLLSCQSASHFSISKHKGTETMFTV